jgi:hypothetical protein
MSAVFPKLEDGRRFEAEEVDRVDIVPTVHGYKVQVWLSDGHEGSFSRPYPMAESAYRRKADLVAWLVEQQKKQKES